MGRMGPSLVPLKTKGRSEIFREQKGGPRSQEPANGDVRAVSVGPRVTEERCCLSAPRRSPADPPAKVPVPA